MSDIPNVTNFRKYKDSFIYIVCPLIVLLIGGYLGHKYKNNLSNPWIWSIFVYKGLLRVFFELALGCILYKFASYMKNINFTKLSLILFTLLMFAGFTSIFVLINLKNAHSRFDYIMIVILFISISIAFSEKNIVLRLFNNKLFYYLEKLSLPMYLNQDIIINALRQYIIRVGKIHVNYFKVLFFILFTSVIVSIIELFVIDLLKKVNWKKIKAIFVEIDK